MKLGEKQLCKPCNIDFEVKFDNSTILCIKLLNPLGSATEQILVVL